MTLGNDRKELRSGEKFTVTVDQVLHNTLLVFLEYRRTKFSGVLLNTSNRCAPYGLKDTSTPYYKAYDIDPEKANSSEPKIEKKKLPFPSPLEMRTTYGQKIPLPPARQIYNRKRRSKRKVRMDMMSTDEAIKIHLANSGKKLLSHHSTCCCDTCADAGLTKIHVNRRKNVKGKRRILTEAENDKLMQTTNKRSLIQGVSSSTEDPKRLKLEEENGDEQSHDKEEQQVGSTDDEAESIKRSPVIKISYKSPGGKGRVLKIPPRLHSPSISENPTENGSKKTRIQQQARKAINRAKSERMKYLHERKRKTEKKFTVRKPYERRAVTPFITVKHPIVGAQIHEKERQIKLEYTAKTMKTIEHPPSEMKYQTFLSLQKDQNLKRNDVMNKSLMPIKLEPTVLLKPLQTRRSKEGGEVISEVDLKFSASAPSQNAVKHQNLLPRNNSVAQEASDQVQATVSSGTGETEERIKKWKFDYKQSHSISVTRCTTQKGVQFCQGDVVWGKIMGFPWWPGLIRKITVKKANGILSQEAVVDWFQSKTVSHIACQSLEGFTDYFNKRFDKKRKGKYKLAIRDAQEAAKKMSPEVRALITQFET